MTFELPALSDIRYRLWRLRRLIALGTFIPLLVFTLMGLTGLNSADVSASALIVPAAILFTVVGGHAVLFPNATRKR